MVRVYDSFDDGGVLEQAKRRKRVSNKPVTPDYGPPQQGYLTDPPVNVEVDQAAADARAAEYGPVLRGDGSYRASGKFAASRAKNRAAAEKRRAEIAARVAAHKAAAFEEGMMNRHPDQPSILPTGGGGGVAPPTIPPGQQPDGEVVKDYDPSAMVITSDNAEDMYEYFGPEKGKRAREQWREQIESEYGHLSKEEIAAEMGRVWPDSQEYHMLQEALKMRGRDAKFAEDQARNRAAAEKRKSEREARVQAHKGAAWVANMRRRFPAVAARNDAAAAAQAAADARAAEEAKGQKPVPTREDAIQEARDKILGKRLQKEYDSIDIKELENAVKEAENNLKSAKSHVSSGETTEYEEGVLREAKGALEKALARREQIPAELDEIAGRAYDREYGASSESAPAKNQPQPTPATPATPATPQEEKRVQKDPDDPENWSMRRTHEYDGAWSIINESTGERIGIAKVNMKRPSSIMGPGYGTGLVDTLKLRDRWIDLPRWAYLQVDDVPDFVAGLNQFKAKYAPGVHGIPNDLRRGLSEWMANFLPLPDVLENPRGKRPKDFYNARKEFIRLENQIIEYLGWSLKVKNNRVGQKDKEGLFGGGEE